MTGDRRPTQAERVLALVPPDVAITSADLLRLSGLSRPTLSEALNWLLAQGAVLSEPGLPDGNRHVRRIDGVGHLPAACSVPSPCPGTKYGCGSPTTPPGRRQTVRWHWMSRSTPKAPSMWVRSCSWSPWPNWPYPTELRSASSSACRARSTAQPTRSRPCGILPAWVGLHPAKELRRRLPGMTVSVENDANLAVVGEAHRRRRSRMRRPDLPEARPRDRCGDDPCRRAVSGCHRTGR